MVELHKRLSSTAIKLSVYSSVLDFGLTMSVLLLQKNELPAGATNLLINIFDNAITYITLLIISLFAAAFILKHREKVIRISPTALLERQAKRQPVEKIKISAVPAELIEPDQRKAIIRIPAVLKQDDLSVERVVNSKNESFIRFNGMWYKSGEGRFERVTRPEYSPDDD